MSVQLDEDLRILNCPFCGSSNVAVRLYNQPSVCCADCLAMGPGADRLTKSPDNQNECRNQAIKLWNERLGSLIKSVWGNKNNPGNRPFSIFLIDGTKISLEREGKAAWLKIGSALVVKPMDPNLKQITP